MKKVTSLALFLAFIPSSVTLWLFESSLKYIRSFEALLILAVYYSLFGDFKKTRLEMWKSIMNSRYHM